MRVLPEATIPTLAATLNPALPRIAANARGRAPRAAVAATTLLLVVAVGLASLGTASGFPAIDEAGPVTLVGLVATAEEAAGSADSGAVGHGARGYDDGRVLARGDGSGVFSAPFSYSYATSAGRVGGGDDLTRVGRWMNADEQAAMTQTGRVQPNINGAGHQSVAHPANIESYMMTAKPGTRYVEFDVPSSSLVQGGKEGWAVIPGPDSIHTRLAQSRGLPGFEYPEATNIEWLASRIRP